MEALYDWILVEKYSLPDEGVAVDIPDETRFMESLATPVRVLSAGKVLGVDGWEELPVKAGDVVMCSLIGALRIRRRGKVVYGLRYGQLICKLTDYAQEKEGNAD